MRVTQEIVSVLPDPLAGEVHVVLAGLKISLLPDEAELVLREMAAALERLKGASAGAPGAAPEAWSVRRAAAEPEARAAPDPMQLRTRALVQAMMQEKGLALRPEDEAP
jgi:hypothetical protein